MIYVEAPNKIQPVDYMKKSIFLAGGITGCGEWQSHISSYFQYAVELIDTDLVVINPRRKDFPINDPTAAYEQIKWEFENLRFADLILFWFPPETLCPIVLFELGAWSMTTKPIFIGIHPSYQRKQDVEIQISFVRPDVKICYSLAELAEQVINAL